MTLGSIRSNFCDRLYPAWKARGHAVALPPRVCVPRHRHGAKAHYRARIYNLLKARWAQQRERRERRHTLCFEALIAFFHDAESWVALKVLGPHSDELQSSILDFVMGGLYDEAGPVRGTTGGKK